VWVNDREVGRTPVELDFLYYGAYDVRIEHETCESIMTSRRIDAPWWDAPFIDIAAEALPVQMLSTPVWHFELSPKNNNLNDLLDRATLFRELEGGDQE
jgi:hypothetical protein